MHAAESRGVMALRLADAPRLSAPGQASLALATALEEGQLEAAAACFSRDACFLTPDATVIHGRDEIRPILAQLIARRTRIEVLSSSVLVAGEVALASERWRFHSPGEAAGCYEQLTTADLVFRAIEGSWKLAVAAPWGWGWNARRAGI